ncbi:MAG: hypothetical protein PHO66_07200 [Eubacteriales bacterium]|nr:hypothetical protein [Eubacteriales bacterium]
MSNIALQLQRQAGGAVAVAGNIVFDSEVHAAGNISYNSATGVITFGEAGRYTFSWWVATQTTVAGGPALALATSQGHYLPGNSPAKAGQVTGMGIVDIAAAPVSAVLVNAGVDTLFYAAQLPLSATLVVLQDDMPLPGPTGPTGPDGPVGPTGPAGPTSMQDTMTCFAEAQFANFLTQMITAYPTTTWTVFSQSLASYSGVPLDLYTAPGATGPGLLRLVDSNGDYEILPIANITALYPGDGTVYDPAFTFLPPPSPLPLGCDTDRIAAIQSYLAPGTDVNVRLGPSISASGSVYRNEYGVLVLSDADGNTPIVLFTPHILRVFIEDAAGRSATPAARPVIRLDA